MLILLFRAIVFPRFVHEVPKAYVVSDALSTFGVVPHTPLRTEDKMPPSPDTSGRILPQISIPATMLEFLSLPPRSSSYLSPIVFMHLLSHTDCRIGPGKGRA